MKRKYQQNAAQNAREDDGKDGEADGGHKADRPRGIKDKKKRYHLQKFFFRPWLVEYAEIVSSSARSIRLMTAQLRCSRESAPFKRLPV